MADTQQALTPFRPRIFSSQSSGTCLFILSLSRYSYLIGHLVQRLRTRCAGFDVNIQINYVLKSLLNLNAYSLMIC